MADDHDVDMSLFLTANEDMSAMLIEFDRKVMKLKDSVLRRQEDLLTPW